MSMDAGPMLTAEQLQAAEAERAPASGPTSPGRWLKDNLFSSVSNTIQTAVFVLVALGALRWLLGLIFAPESLWASVWTNLRLLFSYNYPAEQYIRIWFSLGVLMVAIALTLVAWNLRPRLSIRKAAINVTMIGATAVILGLLAPAAAPRVWMIGVGLALAVPALLLLKLAPGVTSRTVPFMTTLLALVALVVAALWLVPFGRYLFTEGEAIHEPGTVSMSTKAPWTIVLAILVGVFLVARAVGPHLGLARLRLAMVVFWVFGPAFLIFLVLRDPTFDWAHVWSTDVPMAAGFALGGGLLLYWLSDPGRTELARAVGAVLFGFALFNWVAAFFGWYPMLQKARISFLLLALFALTVPTFAGERSARLRIAGAWLGLMVIAHWLITGINTPSTLDIAAPPFLGGFVLTLSLAYYVMLASFPIGILMALARTSKLPIFRMLATVYIEFVRGIPLITVLFFFSVMVNLFLPEGMDLSELAAIFLGYTLFSGAYMAENIRGGLQSIRQGQFEASDALGLSGAQRTVFIVLPQALRVSIPNLVGQAIATFKETSLVAIVGAFELLRIAYVTIPNQPGFLGQTRPALLFISAVYFVFAYSMSRASRNLESKLGVGQR